MRLPRAQDAAAQRARICQLVFEHASEALSFDVAFDALCGNPMEMQRKVSILSRIPSSWCSSVFHAHTWRPKRQKENGDTLPRRATCFLVRSFWKPSLNGKVAPSRVEVLLGAARLGCVGGRTPLKATASWVICYWRTFRRLHTSLPPPPPHPLSPIPAFPHPIASTSPTKYGTPYCLN